MTDAGKMIDKYLDINGIREIQPLHEATDNVKLAQLVDSLTTDGWLGRPLLIMACGNHNYEALTGSHRLAALGELSDQADSCACDDEVFDAIMALAIPIAIVDADVVDAIYADNEDLMQGGDDHRLDLLERYGDKRAAQLMAAEIAAAD